MSGCANFKLGACTVTYGGNVLGHTTGGINIAYEAGVYDRKADQNYDDVCDQIITSQMITITGTFKEIDNAMSEYLESDEIGQKLGESVFPTPAKALLLTPINETDGVSYNFPNAIMSPSFTMAAYTGTEDDTIEMEFIARKSSTGKIMEKVTSVSY